MNKWTKHIEDCIKASLEYGPDARFTHDDKVLEPMHGYAINTVVTNLTLGWRYIPPLKPDIEQWGNEYELQHVPNHPSQKTIYWHGSRNGAQWADLGNDDELTAVHRRIVDGKTGKTKFFQTLEVISDVR